ncbi:hypothetical protein E4U39_002182 [Claviceps sp. Clav50 group G5]|nr:hypothetical protein E4U39_002182 [Claviceps sp. Clav50 group G5]
MSHLSRSDWNSLSRDTTELASLHEQSHKEQSFKADGPHISRLRSIKSAEDIDMQQYRDSTAVNRIGASVGYQTVQAQDHYESASQQHLSQRADPRVVLNRLYHHQRMIMETSHQRRVPLVRKGSL